MLRLKRHNIRFGAASELNATQLHCSVRAVASTNNKRACALVAHGITHNESVDQCSIPSTR